MSPTHLPDHVAIVAAGAPVELWAAVSPSLLSLSLSVVVLVLLFWFGVCVLVWLFFVLFCCCCFGLVYVCLFVCFLFCFVLFCFVFETGFLSVVLAVLELAL